MAIASQLQYQQSRGLGGHAVGHEQRHSQRSSQNHASMLRHNSAISTSSLSSIDDESVYEAEVILDEDSLERLQYIDPNAAEKDDSGKLCLTTTNGSVGHPAPEVDGCAAQLAENPRTSRTAHDNAGDRNSLVLGSPPSGSMFRGIDYSEYTYDLGWTAASRIHSRNSSLFRTPTVNFANAPAGAFGSPGFGSPGFLAQHMAALEAVSRTEGNGSEVTSACGVDDLGEEVVTQSTPLLPPSSEPITIVGRAIENSAGDISIPAEEEGLPTTGTSPVASIAPLYHPGISAEGEAYADTDMATLIDYASPRVPPFPSAAEAEELLYSRMSPQSRAAIAKLMRGRSSAGMRPHRFRPPISQNLGYGAIQRHPFYYAPSRSSSNARSVRSEPGATTQPAYRRLNRTLYGELGDDDIGFWDSLKSFFLAECCFCVGSARDDES
ncbi:hypothetical protein V1525DRAFT_127212 [Lipomyces kononenkoae]|uniref:Uncharacterized protein n=1 Tax=Lipomyces kononenkoae TaxID=34357 RepID=A0ACC3T3B8_LIPKO